MKRLILVVALMCLVGTLATAKDQPAGYIEYTEYTLDNGLRVVMTIVP